MMRRERKFPAAGTLTTNARRPEAQANRDPGCRVTRMPENRAPALRGTASVAQARRITASLQRSGTQDGCGRLANRRSGGAHFVAAKVAAGCRAHLGHREIGLGIVIARIPKEKANAAVAARHLDLVHDVCGGISFRPPCKSLQPGAENDPAGSG